MNNNIVTIRLSEKAIIAYRFLQEKKMKPAKILKDGGEKLLIEKSY